MMFSLLRGVMLAAAIALASSCSAQDKVPALSTNINDFAHLIEDGERVELENAIHRFETSNAVVLVVVTVNSFEPFPTLRAFAAEVFKNRGRGIGYDKVDNGVLIVVAAKERQVWITPGLGIETTVTDAAAADVVNSMVEEFKRGAYGAGLRAGVAALSRLFASGGAP